MLQEIPYWWHDALPTLGARKAVESSCDVVIIGAGYTGLSAAIELARTGKSVQVFDRGIAGAGASSMNGGILSGNLRLGLKASMDAYGEEVGLAFYNEGIVAREAFREFAKLEAIDCDLKYNGRFTGAMTAKDFEAMKRAATFENDALGTNIRILERINQNEIIGSNIYHGGILRDDIGSIHPAKFFQGLLRVAIDAGVIIHENTPVTDISGQFLIQILHNRSIGKIKCKNVIVATNGYGDNSNGWLRRRVVPITSRMIATNIISPDIISKLMPKMGTFGEARYLARYYRPSPDGTRILLGGRDVLAGNNPNGAVKKLTDNLITIFPELREIGVQYHWSGQVAFTRDEMPSLFEKNGIIYVCGYCGSGTIWAPWLGRKAAHIIMENKKKYTVFLRQPPKAIPMYYGWPWFLPFVIAWFGLWDWIKGR